MHSLPKVTILPVHLISPFLNVGKHIYVVPLTLKKVGISMLFVDYQWERQRYTMHYRKSDFSCKLLQLQYRPQEWIQSIS